MTVTTNTNKVQALGNGATKTFPYSFRIYSASDLVVTSTDLTTGVDTVLVLNTDYTVTGAGSYNGGNVVLSGDAPSTTTRITIQRVLDVTQQTDLRNQGAYFAETHEDVFDKLTMVDQQQQEAIDRSLRLPASSKDVSTVLPNPVGSQVVGWNAEGSALKNYGPVDNTLLAIDLANNATPTKGAAMIGWDGTTLDAILKNAIGKVVTSIAGLKAVDKTKYTQSFVTGYYAAGDGGGGAYYYDAADTTTADNGGTVIVASDGGRWKLIVGDELSVRQFGAKGDGETNDTSAIQACYMAGAGKTIDHGDGYTYIINASLTMATGSVYKGKSIIKALAAAGIAGAMMNAASKSGIRITELEIDGNAANNGANYGIKFASGSYNLIDHDVHVHDTLQAGCVIESEDGTKVFGRYVNCGRVSGTDNHGIMVYSIGATPVKNVTVTARVVGAYRKGITTYSASPGTVVGVRIADCDVSGCGLGGIYIANAPGGIDQDGIVLDSNQAYSNYVNFVIDNCKNVSGFGNVSRSSTGAHGVLIEHCRDVELGIVDSDAYTGGIRVNGGLSVNLVNPVVARPNRSIGGFGAGIELLDSTYCVVANPIITDDSGPRMTHGIIEQGTSDYNHIDGGVVTNATTAQVTMLGSNSSLHRRSGRNHGFSTATPLNTVDISGGLTIRGQNLTLSNGLNAGVALPSNAGLVIVSGPTGAYSIGGIAGGHDGRRLTLHNYTTQTLTLVHQEATATAANRLTLSGSVNRTVASFAAVELIYSSQVGAWICLN